MKQAHSVLMKIASFPPSVSISTLRLDFRYSQLLNQRKILETSSWTKWSVIHTQNSRTGNSVSSTSQEIPRTITFKGLSKSAVWTRPLAMKHSRSKNDLVLKISVPCSRHSLASYHVLSIRSQTAQIIICSVTRLQTCYC